MILRRNLKLAWLCFLVSEGFAVPDNAGLQPSAMKNMNR